jgi:O-antigen/teichoic acid export membrane protein
MRRPVTTPAAETGTLAGDTARVLGAQIAGNAGYFVSVLLLARGLAPADRGSVAFITVCALIIANLANLGTVEATKVFAAKRPGDRPSLLANTILASCVGALAGGGITALALWLLPGVRPAGVGETELALLCAGAVAGGIAIAGAGFLQGCGRFGPYARVTATAPWLYAVLVAATWAAFGLSVRDAAAAWAIAQAVTAAVLCVASARGTGIGRLDLRLLWESVTFGVRAWLGGLAHVLNARIDQVLMGLLATQAALGSYAVAVNASEVLFYLPSAAAAALLPAVARAGAEAGADRTLRVFRATMLVTLPCVIAAVVLGPVLLPAVFGAAYDNSVGPFLWLAPSAIGFAASAVFSNALLASGAPALSSLGPAVSLIVGIGLDIVLIPAFGAPGAAAAASAALLSGGAVAAIAYGARAGLRPSALVPRRADAELLMILATRRAGARPS